MSHDEAEGPEYIQSDRCAQDLRLNTPRTLLHITRETKDPETPLFIQHHLIALAGDFDVACGRTSQQPCIGRFPNRHPKGFESDGPMHPRPTALHKVLGEA